MCRYTRHSLALDVSRFVVTINFMFAVIKRQEGLTSLLQQWHSIYVRRFVVN